MASQHLMIVLPTDCLTGGRLIAQGTVAKGWQSAPLLRIVLQEDDWRRAYIRSQEEALAELLGGKTGLHPS